MQFIMPDILNGFMQLLQEVTHYLPTKKPYVLCWETATEIAEQGNLFDTTECHLHNPEYDTAADRTSNHI